MRILRAIAVLLGTSGCGAREPEPSSLEQRAEQLARQTSQSKSSDLAPAPKPEPAAAPASTPTPQPAAPDSAPTGPRVALVLRLDPAITYRIHTVGMVELPLTQQPSGFALEEEVTLHDCEGEDAARVCELRHRYRAFEAEPPAGRFLQTDHDRVAALVTSHRLQGDGARLGTTSVQGSGQGAAEIDAALAEELAQAHRFHCLRFAVEPVGVGAKWNDTCRVWQGGVLATREVVWEVASIDEDPEGTRVLLRFAGRATQKTEGSERVGTIVGELYMWADAGQPHLLRETTMMPLGATGKSTKSVLNVQFARLDPKDGTTLLRTDGKPFPVAPPPAEPTGEPTGDAKSEPPLQR